MSCYELVDDIDIMDYIHDESLSFEEGNTRLVRADNWSTSISGQLLLVSGFEVRELVRFNRLLTIIYIFKIDFSSLLLSYSSQN